jgi:hypothetical protein
MIHENYTAINSSRSIYFHSTMQHLNAYGYEIVGPFHFITYKVLLDMVQLNLALGKGTHVVCLSLARFGSLMQCCLFEDSLALICSETWLLVCYK